jgi:hypothetical protein
MSRRHAETRSNLTRTPDPKVKSQAKLSRRTRTSAIAGVSKSSHQRRGHSDRRVKTASKAVTNVVSRSQVRNVKEVTRSSNVARWPTVRVTQAPVGRAVTPRRWTRRVPVSIRSKQCGGAGQQCRRIRNHMPENIIWRCWQDGTPYDPQLTAPSKPSSTKINRWPLDPGVDTRQLTRRPHQRYCRGLHRQHLPGQAPSHERGTRRLVSPLRPSPNVLRIVYLVRFDTSSTIIR